MENEGEEKRDERESESRFGKENSQTRNLNAAKEWMAEIKTLVQIWH